MSEELAKLSTEEAALVPDYGHDESDLVIPRIKVGQPLTEEVKAQDARPGDIINTLTGEVYGDSIEFIVAGFEKGRFRTNEEGDVVCTGREDACGCHGGAYEDCPDSEEQYSAAVNRGEKEWGKGPPCATTYNFTGFIPGTDMPVQLSLMRGSAAVAKKFLTMLRFQRAPWDKVFNIETVEKTSKVGSHDYHSVKITQARTPQAEERQQAVGLAGLLRSRSVNVVGADADEKPPTEKPEGSVDY